MKRKINMGLLVCGLIFLCGCGSKDLTKCVTQKQTKVEVGTNINLSDLFECDEEVQIGFKNSDSFNPNKVGTYSIEATISDGSNQIDNNYLINVYDDVSPIINADDIIIYENDDIDLTKKVSVEDNSGEKIEAIIAEQDVDINNPGKYFVKYTAKDSSGNISEKQVSVTVKEKYTYSKLKKITKKIIKDNKLDNLKLDFNDEEGIVWIESDRFIGNKNTDNGLAAVLPSWSLMIEDNKISYRILVHIVVGDVKDYHNIRKGFIKSENGQIESDSTNNSFNYNYGSYACYESFMKYLITDENKISDSIGILSGKNLKFIGKTDDGEYSLKPSKKDAKVVNQLIEFYNELKNFSGE